MYIEKEILRYVASIVISALSFVVIRLLRTIDRCETKIQEHDVAIAEIREHIKTAIAATV